MKEIIERMQLIRTFADSYIMDFAFSNGNHTNNYYDYLKQAKNHKELQFWLNYVDLMCTGAILAIREGLSLNYVSKYDLSFEMYQSEKFSLKYRPQFMPINNYSVRCVN